MKRSQLRHLYRGILRVKPRYFLLAAGICSLICLGGLRHNNQHMVALRDAVYAADKSGGDVQTPLTKLQAYVTAHMNTGLSTGATSVYPPIQLQYTYQRLADARNQALGNQGDLYTQAQAYCQSQNSHDFSGRNRVPCIEQYVKDHGKQAPAISPSLYQFDFVAPKWSPDLAGWSLLATVLLLLLSLTTFIVDRRIKRALR